MSEAPKGHLDLLLLAMLAAGPAHGYAVIERLALRSGGSFELPEGTVYPALHRLERAGLASSRWTHAAGRRRRVYSLTQKGEASLSRRREEWAALARAVESVLEGAA